MHETQKQLDKCMLFAMRVSQPCSRWPPSEGAVSKQWAMRPSQPREVSEGKTCSTCWSSWLTALSSAVAGIYKGVFPEDFTF